MSTRIGTDRGEPPAKKAAMKPRPFSNGIAHELKRRRAEAGLSLQEVADRSGLSLPYLCRLENDKANISLTNLRAVAQTLGVPLAELFLEEDQSRVHMVRRSQRSTRKVSNVRGNSYSEVRFLASGIARLEPILFTLPPEGKSEVFPPHSGEEFAWVTEGAVLVSVGDHDYLLENGDALYYPASLPHRFRNQSVTQASFLLVKSP